MSRLVEKPMKRHQQGQGRPKKLLISLLVINYVHKDTGKDYYSCVAVDRCNCVRAGNAQESRILKHAAYCRYLDPDLKSLASDHAASKSLGAKFEIAESTSELTELQPKKAKTRSLFHNFTDTGHKELQARLDHCIVKLICVTGLVPHILDSAEWKEFMSIANPKYKTTSLDLFKKKLIPNEAAFIRKQVLEILKKERNLTLTFDGNSTRKSQSVYTVHVTTKDRNSYFLDAYEGSDEHHTASWVKDKFLKVCVGFACHQSPVRFMVKQDHPFCWGGKLCRNVF